MLQLPNGCRSSEPSVNPKNWKQVTASTKSDWYIQYYFYTGNATKLVIIKGMNRFKDLTERRTITKSILEDETDRLRSGYNPITGITLDDESKDISPETPFIAALRMAWGKLTCAPSTCMDIKSTLKYIETAAQKLKYDGIAIKDIRRKHVKKIFECCAETKNRWSANTYNAYRKNLGILFKDLVEIDAMETNIIRDLSKQKVVRRIKRVLTPNECKIVSDWTEKYDRRFWLLIHIFFHSGCRTTELFRVKKEHVNLERQTVLFTVLKGSQPFEVEKPVKNIAVDFWREAVEGAKPGQYIFGKGLLPSGISISSKQVTRRWKRHIKNKLGIVCDWYSLKHLNTDQVSAAKGIKTAGLLNSHTSEGTTKIYAIGEQGRMNEEIKLVNNYFG